MLFRVRIGAFNIDRSKQKESSSASWERLTGAEIVAQREAAKPCAKRSVRLEKVFAVFFMVTKCAGMRPLAGPLRFLQA
jgi:hypothetical protein